MSAVSWGWAAASDVGRVRATNEDRCGVDKELGLFMVCDGMGGHAGGEVAAQIVVETLPLLLQEQLKARTNTNPSAMLRAALVEASGRVRDVARRRPELEGMGATVVALWLYDDTAWVGHMGDSRAYRWCDGILTALTQDHSLVALLLETGDITTSEAAQHPARHQITRFCGMGGEVLPDVNQVKIMPGNRLLLCTDGLTNMVAADVIATIVSAPDLDKACAVLIGMANTAGGTDNATVILIQTT